MAAPRGLFRGCGTDFQIVSFAASDMAFETLQQVSERQSHTRQEARWRLIADGRQARVFFVIVWYALASLTTR
jgi:hypothetical protein